MSTFQESPTDMTVKSPSQSPKREAAEDTKQTKKRKAATAAAAAAATDKQDKQPVAAHSGGKIHQKVRKQVLHDW